MKNLIQNLLHDSLQYFRFRYFNFLFLIIIGGTLEGLALTTVLPLLNAINGHNDQITGSKIAFLYILPSIIGLPKGVTGIGLLLILLIIISAVFFIAEVKLAAQLQSEYGLRWQILLFTRVINADHRFFEKFSDGAIISAIVLDSARVGAAFYHSSLAIANLINLIIYFTLAMMISAQTSLALAAVGILLYFCTKSFMSHAYDVGKKISIAQNELQTLVTEYVTLSKIIKINVAESYARSNFEAAAKKLAKLNYFNAYNIMKSKAIFEYGGAASIAGILVICPTLFNISLDEILVILGLFIRILPRFTAFQQSGQALISLLPALTSINTICDTARAFEERNSQIDEFYELSNLPLEITFRDVKLEKSGKEIIKGVSFVIPRGKIIAIIGLSGSGKSTLVDSILGLVSIKSGSILINEHNIEDISKQDLRDIIGYVGQDTTLFSGSVRENILLDNSHDSSVDLNRALFLSDTEFFLQDSLGLDKFVESRGANLSGGERQRISFARAVRKQRRLFILDEVTSSVDAVTESKIVKSIKSLSEHATIIIIAHRFSTVVDADIIFVMEDGQLVEKGSWHELDRPGTRFAALKAMQDLDSKKED